MRNENIRERLKVENITEVQESETEVVLTRQEVRPRICRNTLGPVAGTGRRLGRDEDPTSRLASLSPSELYFRVARQRRNVARHLDDPVYSHRGH